MEAWGFKVQILQQMNLDGKLMFHWCPCVFLKDGFYPHFGYYNCWDFNSFCLKVQLIKVNRTLLWPFSLVKLLQYYEQRWWSHYNTVNVWKGWVRCWVFLYNCKTKKALTLPLNTVDWTGLIEDDRSKKKINYPPPTVDVYLDLMPF